MNYHILHFPHVKIGQWDEFLEVGSPGQSAQSFVILMHRAKLPSTEDLFLETLPRYTFTINTRVPGSGTGTEYVTKIFRFLLIWWIKKWYFNRIILWISIILSDAAYLLSCLGLYLLYLFIFKLSFIPIPYFLTAFLVFS